jgi:hypothetical protein
MTLFETGIRPKIDEYLDAKAKEKRNYGEYWSASSAGYCMRKNIFERLHVPHTSEDSRKQRVFEVGHIFHGWIQEITRNAGVSIAQELELQDEELMIRGHIDDLVLTKTPITDTLGTSDREDLILYDYKTQNSRAFTWQKDKPMSYFHKMQLGTYMMMLRRMEGTFVDKPEFDFKTFETLTEGRILKISKDDLRMTEDALYWNTELESRITTYWRELNTAWKRLKETGSLPPCTCADRENGFMANEKWNPFFYNGEPCSVEWFEQHKDSVMQRL